MVLLDSKVEGKEPSQMAVAECSDKRADACQDDACVKHAGGMEVVRVERPCRIKYAWGGVSCAHQLEGYGEDFQERYHGGYGLWTCGR